MSPAFWERIAFIIWFQNTLTIGNTYRKLHDIEYGKLLKEKYAIKNNFEFHTLNFVNLLSSPFEHQH